LLRQIPVLLVFGKQLHRDGTIPKELDLQMKKGRAMLEADPSARMLIMGGVTEPGLPSEAQSARSCLPMGLYERDVKYFLPLKTKLIALRSKLS